MDEGGHEHTQGQLSLPVPQEGPKHPLGELAAGELTTTIVIEKTNPVKVIMDVVRGENLAGAVRARTEREAPNPCRGRGRPRPGPGRATWRTGRRPWALPGTLCGELPQLASGGLPHPLTAADAGEQHRVHVRVAGKHAQVARGLEDDSRHLLQPLDAG